MVQLARSGGGGRGPFDLLHQLLDRRTLTQIDEFVGIRHAEIDFVARMQFVLQHLFAVHKRAMATAHVFECPTAIFGEDLGLLAADTAVAKSEFVAGLPANAKGRSVQRYIAANAARFNDNNAWRAWHGLNARRQGRHAESPPGAIQHAMVGKLGPEVKCPKRLPRCEKKASPSPSAKFDPQLLRNFPRDRPQPGHSNWRRAPTQFLRVYSDSYRELSDSLVPRYCCATFQLSYYSVAHANRPAV